MDNSLLQGKLIRVLIQIPAFNGRANRDALLISLPQNVVVAIPRDDQPIPDINGIIRTLDSLGQLDSGDWPLAILIRNALLFAPPHTKAGHQLEELLACFEYSFNRKPLPPLKSMELVIGPDERLPVDFLEKGLRAQLAVARLHIPRFVNGTLTGSVAGTGWMFSPGLMFTNYHVIAARMDDEPGPSKDDLASQAKGSTAWFGYNQYDGSHTDYQCSELVCSDPALDYALLRLSPISLDGQTALQKWGTLCVAEKPEFHPGIRLNIIQHPQGFQKRLAIRSNFFIKKSSSNPVFIQYITDTEPGSSGSPVLNDQWEVVALHHASVRVDEHIYSGQTIQFHNEGIQMSAVLAAIRSAGIL